MKRAERFYTEIRDLNYQNHRFNAFGEIVSDFVDGDLPATRLPFRIDQAALDVLGTLVPGWQSKTLVAIHPGASVPTSSGHRLILPDWSVSYRTPVIRCSG